MENGLIIYASAPAKKASSLSDACPNVVIITIGIIAQSIFPLILRQTASPFIFPGITISRNIRSGSAASRIARASSPQEASITSNGECRKAVEINNLTSLRSSITRIFLFFAIGFLSNPLRKCRISLINSFSW